MVNFSSLEDDKLIELLRSGAVGVLPTDTVYGLVCLATDKATVERLYRVKHRDKKPGTLVAASVDQFVELGIPRRYLTAVEHYWPNPISVVVPSVPSLSYLDQGKMSLALRIPSDLRIVRLLQKTGPLLTTSANMPRQPTARTIEEAQAAFGDSVDYYVDGGDLSGRPASTIIRIIDDAVEVIRQGAIKINEKGEIES